MLAACFLELRRLSGVAQACLEPDAGVGRRCPLLRAPFDHDGKHDGEKTQNAGCSGSHF